MMLKTKSNYREKKFFNQYGEGKIGELLRSIINIFPSSDPNARALLPGEKHIPQILPNKKIGMSNFTGPGTQVVRRIKRRDPARTPVDRVSKAHDIRYSLAKTSKDISDADDKMIAKLLQMKRNKKGNPLNRQVALRGIQLKKVAQKTGLIRKKLFISGKRPLADEKALLKTELTKLEQQGFGKKVKKLPGEDIMAKMSRLRSMRGKKKRKKGKGLRLAGGRHKGRRTTSGKGLRLAGGRRILPAKIILERILPIINKRLLGGGLILKKISKKKLRKKLTKKVHRARKRLAQSGKGIGAVLLGLAGTAASVIVPIIISLVKKGIAKIKAAKKQKGKGIKVNADKLKGLLTENIALAIKDPSAIKKKGFLGDLAKEVINSISFT